MKKIILPVLLLIGLHSYSQSVFGYWYGKGNVKNKAAANNYLVEMIVQPEKGYVKAILNYFFKNTYRSLQLKGKYNSATRELTLYNIPVTYFASPPNLEVDCMMDLVGTLRVARAGSVLTGQFVSQSEYKYMCPEIVFSLSLNASISKKDSVMKAIREFKETYQAWKPSATDTLVAARIIQRKVQNYVVEAQFKERQIEVADDIEVNSDTLQVDFYDNGEVDGDSISVFFNDMLLAFSQRLSARSIHFDLALDSTKEINELSMFADNLGSIPPNTALMVVFDGKTRREIRLSSNLQKNGTIRIRRKKPAQN